MPHLFGPGSRLIQTQAPARRCIVIGKRNRPAQVKTRSGREIQNSLYQIYIQKNSCLASDSDCSSFFGVEAREKIVVLHNCRLFGGSQQPLYKCPAAAKRKELKRERRHEIERSRGEGLDGRRCSKIN